MRDFLAALKESRQTRGFRLESEPDLERWDRPFVQGSLGETHNVYRIKSDTLALKVL
jgi:hypothetical protein